MSDTRRKTLNRRDFLRSSTLWIGGVIAGVLGIPSFGYLAGPALVSNDDESAANLGLLNDYPIGTPIRTEITRTRVNGWERTSVNHGMYVVRMGKEDVRVFSDICTHLGCRVTWHPEIANYVSPCHDGHFDMLGHVVSGPPPRPLDEYAARVEAGRLVVRLPPRKRSAKD